MSAGAAIRLLEPSSFARAAAAGEGDRGERSEWRGELSNDGERIPLSTRRGYHADCDNPTKERKVVIKRSFFCAECQRKREEAKKKRAAEAEGEEREANRKRRKKNPATVEQKTRHTRGSPVNNF